ncbi:hypothetical protein EKN38_13070 [Enterobacter sp. WCHEn045836]|uniref:hypothetical protein n=1 Tax=Enterobacter sp. WCHEn045836 TaxID=2497434 RepID=UPI000F81C960|nr:hypothetical protein [Enterobacter sp. WCHEn045836]RTQ01300.1 hypothetical protein EKN38_13070 [Enterobacter sp. WCHEn045836]
MTQNYPAVKLQSAVMYHTGIMLYADMQEDFWLKLGHGLGWGRFTGLHAGNGFKVEGVTLFQLAEIRPESEKAPDIVHESDLLWDARAAMDVEIQDCYLKNEYRVEKLTPSGSVLSSNQSPSEQRARLLAPQGE